VRIRRWPRASSWRSTRRASAIQGMADRDLTVKIEWGDGTVEPAADITLLETPGSEVCDDGLDLGRPRLCGRWRVYRDGDVTDDEGAEAGDTFTVTVQNVAPMVEAGTNRRWRRAHCSPWTRRFSDPGSILRWRPFSGARISPRRLTGAMDDRAGGGYHAAETSGGEGVPTTGTIQARHAYADDGVYTVTVTVEDDDAAWNGYVSVIVTNVAPIVEAGADQEADEGQEVSFAGSFSDASPADTHTITCPSGRQHGLRDSDAGTHLRR